jgi:hypothetical protein
MAPLSLSEPVIVKCEDFNLQFVDGVGIIHIFLYFKSQQNVYQPICCVFILKNPICQEKQTTENSGKIHLTGRQANFSKAVIVLLYQAPAVRKYRENRHPG